MPLTQKGKEMTTNLAKCQNCGDYLATQTALWQDGHLRVIATCPSCLTQVSIAANSHTLEYILDELSTIREKKARLIKETLGPEAPHVCQVCHKPQYDTLPNLLMIEEINEDGDLVDNILTLDLVCETCRETILKQFKGLAKQITQPTTAPGFKTKPGVEHE